MHHTVIFETFPFLPVVTDTTLRALHMLVQQSTSELCSPSLFIFLLSKTQGCVAHPDLQLTFLLYPLECRYVPPDLLKPFYFETIVDSQGITNYYCDFLSLTFSSDHIVLLSYRTVWTVCQYMCL